MNLVAWALSNYRLGNIYYSSRGLKQPNYKKAREYLENVLIPEIKDIDLSTWKFASKILEKLNEMDSEKELTTC